MIRLLGFIGKARALSGPVVMASVGGAVVVVFCLLALLADIVAPYDPAALSGPASFAPSATHLLGTDAIGRDVLSRVIHGARVSIPVGLVAAMVASSAGIALGLVSGYFGGRLDRVLAIPLDTLYAFPAFLLALMVSVAIGGGVGNTALAVGIARIPIFYRVARGATLAVREHLIIEVENALGAGDRYILAHHVAPRISAPVIVLLTFDVGRAVLTVAGLGFLGFGVPPPTPEWGTDLSLGQRHLLSGVWWPTFFPGTALLILVLGFNLLGEGLMVLMNPRVRDFR